MGQIYVASKATAHAPLWKEMREAGWPIISSWIDEAEPGMTLDWTDLWSRCLGEAARADVLLVYMEPGEVLKGAWIELGVALGLGKPVFGVGIEDFSIAKSGKIRMFEGLSDALLALRCHLDRPDLQMPGRCHAAFEKEMQTS